MSVTLLVHAYFVAGLFLLSGKCFDEADPGDGKFDLPESPGYIESHRSVILSENEVVCISDREKPFWVGVRNPQGLPCDSFLQEITFDKFSNFLVVETENIHFMYGSLSWDDQEVLREGTHAESLL